MTRKIINFIRKLFNGNIQAQNFEIIEQNNIIMKYLNIITEQNNKLTEQNKNFINNINLIISKIEDIVNLYEFYNKHNNNIHKDLDSYLKEEFNNAKILNKELIDNFEKQFFYSLSINGPSSKILNELYNSILIKNVKNKKAVVTAITGDYEDLKTPLYSSKGWDYICFTDNEKLKSSFWKIICLDRNILEELGAINIDNPRLHAKFYKQMIHIVCKDYEETLWCDASFRIVSNIEDYINMYSKNYDMLCVKHPYWDCIYEEANRAIELGTDDPKVITKQINRYRKEGFPEHYGQITGFLLYRKHTDSVKRVNEMWYNETMNGSNRDQISFEYCCWKLNFKYDICHEDFYSLSPFFNRNKKQAHKNIMPWEIKNILIEKEKKYGGYITNVKRNKVSPYDHRSKEKIEYGGMTGGDRMLNHGYAQKYAEYLQPFIKIEKTIIIEIGILMGTGLAIWCDLFPTSKIYGLDIDLEHINKNMNNLYNLGAFKNNKPKLYEFDQLDCNPSFFENILNGNKITICIDDGLHSDKAIINTLKCIEPFLEYNFAYFIEDNSTVNSIIKNDFNQFDVYYDNRLTILTRKK